MVRRNRNKNATVSNNQEVDNTEDTETEMTTVNNEADNRTNGQTDVDNTGLKGDRVVIGVSVSTKLGKLLEDHAKSANMTLAAVTRQAIAKFLGYDLSQEPIVQRGARTKYATKEEAQAAQRAKVAERNELIKKLLAEYRAKNANNFEDEEENEESNDDN